MVFRRFKRTANVEIVMLEEIGCRDRKILVRDARGARSV